MLNILSHRVAERIEMRHELICSRYEIGSEINQSLLELTIALNFE